MKTQKEFYEETFERWVKLDEDVETVNQYLDRLTKAAAKIESILEGVGDLGSY